MDDTQPEPQAPYVPPVPESLPESDPTESQGPAPLSVEHQTLLDEARHFFRTALIRLHALPDDVDHEFKGIAGDLKGKVYDDQHPDPTKEPSYAPGEQVYPDIEGSNTHATIASEGVLV